MSEIHEGDEVLAKYKADGKWYRAHVDVESGAGRFLVTFLDYGNQVLLNKTEMRRLDGKPFGATSAAAGSSSGSDSDDSGAESDSSVESSEDDSVMEMQWAPGELVRAMHPDDGRYHKARIERLSSRGNYIVKFSGGVRAELPESSIASRGTTPTAAGKGAANKSSAHSSPAPSAPTSTTNLHAGRNANTRASVGTEYSEVQPYSEPVVGRGGPFGTGGPIAKRKSHSSSSGEPEPRELEPLEVEHDTDDLAAGIVKARVPVPAAAGTAPAVQYGQPVAARRPSGGASAPASRRTSAGTATGAPASRHTSAGAASAPSVPGARKKPVIRTAGSLRKAHNAVQHSDSDNPPDVFPFPRANMPRRGYDNYGNLEMPPPLPGSGKPVTSIVWKRLCSKSCLLVFSLLVHAVLILALVAFQLHSFYGITYEEDVSGFRVSNMVIEHGLIEDDLQFGNMHLLGSESKLLGDHTLLFEAEEDTVFTAKHGHVNMNALQGDIFMNAEGDGAVVLESNDGGVVVRSLNNFVQVQDLQFIDNEIHSQHDLVIRLGEDLDKRQLGSKLVVKSGDKDLFEIDEQRERVSFMMDIKMRGGHKLDLTEGSFTQDVQTLELQDATIGEIKVAAGAIAGSDERVQGSIAFTVHEVDAQGALDDALRNEIDVAPGSGGVVKLREEVQLATLAALDSAITLPSDTTLKVEGTIDLSEGTLLYNRFSSLNAEQAHIADVVTRNHRMLLADDAVGSEIELSGPNVRISATGSAGDIVMHGDTTIGTNSGHDLHVLGDTVLAGDVSVDVGSSFTAGGDVTLGSTSVNNDHVHVHASATTVNGALNALGLITLGSAANDAVTLRGTTTAHADVTVADGHDLHALGNVVLGNAKTDALTSTGAWAHDGELTVKNGAVDTRIRTWVLVGTLANYNDLPGANHPVGATTITLNEALLGKVLVGDVVRLNGILPDGGKYHTVTALGADGHSFTLDFPIEDELAPMLTQVERMRAALRLRAADNDEDAGGNLLAYVNTEQGAVLKVPVHAHSALTVDGDADVAGVLHVAGSGVTVSKVPLTATHDVNVGGALAADGALTVGDMVDAVGAVRSRNALIVDADGAGAGTPVLHASADGIVFDTAASAETEFSVDVSGAMQAQQLSIMAGGADITGSTRVTGTLDVTGNLYSSAQLVVSAGGLVASGASRIDGELEVKTGKMVARDGATLEGDVTLNGPVSLAGANNLHVTDGDITVERGKLTVGGDTELQSTLTTGGGIVVQSGGLLANGNSVVSSAALTTLTVESVNDEQGSSFGARVRMQAGGKGVAFEPPKSMSLVTVGPIHPDSPDSLLVQNDEETTVFTLDQDGSSHFINTLSVKAGGATVAGNVDVDGMLSTSAQVRVTDGGVRVDAGGASVVGTVAVDGAIEVTGGAASVSAMTLTAKDGTLRVWDTAAGVATVEMSNAGLVFDADADTNAELHVKADGAVAVAGTVTAESVATSVGHVHAAQDVRADADAVAAGGVYVNAALDVMNTNSVFAVDTDGMMFDANADGTPELALTSAGALTSAHALHVQAGGVDVHGDAVLHDALDVAGAATLTNGLSVTAGGAMVSGSLVANDDVSVANGIKVLAGGASLTGDVEVLSPQSPTLVIGSENTSEGDTRDARLIMQAGGANAGVPAQKMAFVMTGPLNSMATDALLVQNNDSDAVLVLEQTGALAVESRITVNDGGVDVSGDSVLTGDMHVTKQFTAGSVVVDSGDVDVTGSVSTTSTITAGAMLTVQTGGAAVHGDVRAHSDGHTTLTVESTDAVEGNTRDARLVLRAGGVEAGVAGKQMTVQVGGPRNADGPHAWQLVNDTNDVAMMVTQDGKVTSVGHFEVQAGGATVNGAMQVAGDATVTGTLNSAGALTVLSGGADITGTTTLTGSLQTTGSIVSGSVQVQGLVVDTDGDGLFPLFNVDQTGAGFDADEDGGFEFFIDQTGSLQLSNSLVVSSGGASITGVVTTSDDLLSEGALLSKQGVTVDSDANGLLPLFEVNAAKGLQLDVGEDGAVEFGVSPAGALTTAASVTVAAGGVHVSGASDVTGTLSVTDAVTSGQMLTVQAGGASVTGAVDMSATLEVGDTLTVKSGGVVVQGGGLAVTGTVVMTSTLVTGEKVTVSSGGLDVTGNVVLDGTVDVTGDLTVDSATVNGPLVVTQDGASIVGDVLLDGNVTVKQGVLVQGGDVELDTGALTVGGSGTVSGGLTVGTDASVGTNMTVSGALDVGTDVDVHGALAVDGDATLSQDVTVVGNLTLKSDRLEVGSDIAFSIARPARTTAGHGDPLDIVGQEALGTDQNGGDVRLGGGAGTGTGTDGAVVVTSDLVVLGQTQFSSSQTTLDIGDLTVAGGQRTVSTLPGKGDLLLTGEFDADQGTSVRNVVVQGQLTTNGHARKTGPGLIKSRFGQPTVLKREDDETYDLADYVGAGDHIFFVVTPTGTIDSGGAASLTLTLTSGSVNFYFGGSGEVEEGDVLTFDSLPGVETTVLTVLSATQAIMTAAVNVTHDNFHYEKKRRIAFVDDVDQELYVEVGIPVTLGNQAFEYRNSLLRVETHDLTPSGLVDSDGKWGINTEVPAGVFQVMTDSGNGVLVERDGSVTVGGATGGGLMLQSGAGQRVTIDPGNGELEIGSATDVTIGSNLSARVYVATGHFNNTVHIASGKGRDTVDIANGGTLGNTVRVAINDDVPNVVQLGGDSSTSTLSGATISIGTSDDVGETINVGTGRGIDTINVATGDVDGNTVHVATGDVPNEVRIGTHRNALNDITIGGDASTVQVAGSVISVGVSDEDEQIFIGSGDGADQVMVATGNGPNTVHIGTGNAVNTVRVASDHAAANVVQVGGNSSAVELHGATISIGASDNVDERVDIATGTGSDTVNIATGGTNANTINVATGTVANTVRVGGDGANVLSLATGTGADTVNVATGGVSANMVNIATDNVVANVVRMGGQASSVTLSGATVAIGGVNGVDEAINIATGTGVDTVRVATGGTDANTVHIASNDGVANELWLGGDMSAVIVSGATVDVAVADGVAEVVNIATGTGADTVNVATGDTDANLVNVATGDVDNVVVVGGEGANTIQLATGDGNNVVSIGTGASAETVHLGTGGGSNVITVGGAASAVTVRGAALTLDAPVSTTSTLETAEQLTVLSGGAEITGATVLSSTLTVEGDEATVGGDAAFRLRRAERVGDGDGAALLLEGQDAVDAGGTVDRTGGDVTLVAGAGAVNGDGGNVVLRGGLPAGGGSEGIVLVDSGLEITGITKLSSAQTTLDVGALTMAGGVSRVATLPDGGDLLLSGEFDVDAGTSERNVVVEGGLTTLAPARKSGPGVLRSQAGDLTQTILEDDDSAEPIDFTREVRVGDSVFFELTPGSERLDTSTAPVGSVDLVGGFALFGSEIELGDVLIVTSGASAGTRATVTAFASGTRASVDTVLTAVTDTFRFEKRRGVAAVSETELTVEAAVPVTLGNQLWEYQAAATRVASADGTLVHVVNTEANFGIGVDNPRAFLDVVSPAGTVLQVDRAGHLVLADSADADVVDVAVNSGDDVVNVATGSGANSVYVATDDAAANRLFLGGMASETTLESANVWVGMGAVAHSVVVGSGSLSDTVDIGVGATGGSTVRIAAGGDTNSVTIGGATSTTHVHVATGTGQNSVSIGSNSSGANFSTIDIGTGAARNTVSVGSLTTNALVNVQGDVVTLGAYASQEVSVRPTSIVLGPDGQDVTLSRPVAPGANFDMVVRGQTSSDGANDHDGGDVVLVGGVGTGAVTKSNAADGGNIVIDGGEAGGSGAAGDVLVANSRGDVVIGRAASGEFHVDSTVVKAASAEAVDIGTLSTDAVSVSLATSGAGTNDVVIGGDGGLEVTIGGGVAADTINLATGVGASNTVNIATGNIANTVSIGSEVGGETFVRSQVITMGPDGGSLISLRTATVEVGPTSLDVLLKRPDTEFATTSFVMRGQSSTSADLDEDGGDVVMQGGTANKGAADGGHVRLDGGIGAVGGSPGEVRLGTTRGDVFVGAETSGEVHLQSPQISIGDSITSTHTVRIGTGNVTNTILLGSNVTGSTVEILAPAISVGTADGDVEVLSSNIVLGQPDEVVELVRPSTSTTQLRALRLVGQESSAPTTSAPGGTVELVGGKGHSVATAADGGNVVLDGGSRGAVGGTDGVVQMGASRGNVESGRTTDGATILHSPNVTIGSGTLSTNRIEIGATAKANTVTIGSTTSGGVTYLNSEVVQVGTPTSTAVNVESPLVQVGPDDAEVTIGRPATSGTTTYMMTLVGHHSTDSSNAVDGGDVSVQGGKGSGHASANGGDVLLDGGVGNLGDDGLVLVASQRGDVEMGRAAAGQVTVLSPNVAVATSTTVSNTVQIATGAVANTVTIGSPSIGGLVEVSSPQVNVGTPDGVSVALLPPSVLLGSDGEPVTFERPVASQTTEAITVRGQTSDDDQKDQDGGDVVLEGGEGHALLAGAGDGGRVFLDGGAADGTGVAGNVLLATKQGSVELGRVGDGQFSVYMPEVYLKEARVVDISTENVLGSTVQVATSSTVNTVIIGGDGGDEVVIGAGTGDDVISIGTGQGNDSVFIGTGSVHSDVSIGTATSGTTQVRSAAITLGTTGGTAVYVAPALLEVGESTAAFTISRPTLTSTATTSALQVTGQTSTSASARDGGDVVVAGGNGSAVGGSTGGDVLVNGGTGNATAGNVVVGAVRGDVTLGRVADGAVHLNAPSVVIAPGTDAVPTVEIATGATTNGTVSIGSSGKGLFTVFSDTITLGDASTTGGVKLGAPTTYVGPSGAAATMTRPTATSTTRSFFLRGQSSTAEGQQGGNLELLGGTGSDTNGADADGGHVLIDGGSGRGAGDPGEVRLGVTEGDVVLGRGSGGQVRIVSHLVNLGTGDVPTLVTVGSTNSNGVSQVVSPTVSIGSGNSNTITHLFGSNIEFGNADESLLMKRTDSSEGTSSTEIRGQTSADLVAARKGGAIAITGGYGYHPFGVITAADGGSVYVDGGKQGDNGNGVDGDVYLGTARGSLFVGRDDGGSLTMSTPSVSVATTASTTVTLEMATAPVQNNITIGAAESGASFEVYSETLTIGNAVSTMYLASNEWRIGPPGMDLNMSRPSSDGETYATTITGQSSTDAALDQDGGELALSAGDGAQGGNGGHVRLNAGAGGGSGTAGEIRIGRLRGDVSIGRNGSGEVRVYSPVITLGSANGSGKIYLGQTTSVIDVTVGTSVPGGSTSMLSTNIQVGEATGSTVTIGTPSIKLGGDCTVESDKDVLITRVTSAVETHPLYIRGQTSSADQDQKGGDVYVEGGTGRLFDTSADGGHVYIDGGAGNSGDDGDVNVGTQRGNVAIGNGTGTTEIFGAITMSGTLGASTCVDVGGTPLTFVNGILTSFSDAC